MAERKADIKVSIKPDSGDPAAPFAAVARASRTAKSEADKLRASIAKNAAETKTASGLITSLMTAEAKKTAEATNRVNELANAIKRTGATTQQVQGFARTLGREMQLTTTQINQALTKAGQLPLAGRGRGGGGGRLGMFGGGLINALGPEALAAGVIHRLGSSASEALKTNADQDLKQSISESNDSAAKFISTFHDGIPILEQVRDLFTESERANAAAAQEDAKRAKARFDAARAERAERIDRASQRNAQEAAFGAIPREMGARDIEIEAMRRASTKTADILQQQPGRFANADTGALELAKRKAQESEETARTVANRARERAQADQAEVVRQAGEIGNAQSEVTRRTAKGEKTSIDEIIASARDKQVTALQGQQKELERAKSAEQRIADKAMERAQIENQLAQVKSQRLKAEADEAKAQAKQTRDSIESASAAFGSQTSDEQRSTLEAARKFQKGGIGSLTPEELQRLKGTGLFDDQIKKQAQARAQASGFGELQKIAGAEGRAADQEATAKKLQAEAEKIKIKAEVQLAFDTDQIGQALQLAFQKLDQKILEVVRASIERGNEANDARRRALKENYTGGK